MQNTNVTQAPLLAMIIYNVKGYDEEKYCTMDLSVPNEYNPMPGLQHNQDRSPRAKDNYPSRGRVFENPKFTTTQKV